MKFNVKHPDGHTEETAHSAETPQDYAVSGFGRNLADLEADGFEITAIMDEAEDQLTLKTEVDPDAQP